MKTSQSDLPKSPMTKPEGVREPLVGGDVRLAMQAGRGDLRAVWRRWRRCAGNGSDPLSALSALARRR